MDLKKKIFFGHIFRENLNKLKHKSTKKDEHRSLLRGLFTSATVPVVYYHLPRTFPRENPDFSRPSVNKEIDI